MTFLPPQVDELTGSRAPDDQQRVDVEAVHVVVERQTVLAFSAQRREHNPEEQLPVTVSQHHQ